MSPIDDLINDLKYNSDGLIPAIVQDNQNGEVLMMAWMNKESLARTIETGMCNYWSRSRQTYWLKGETSGHVQHVKRITTDCDKDTLLIFVEQVGAACHNNYRSCFYRDVTTDGLVENAKPIED